MRIFSCRFLLLLSLAAPAEADTLIGNFSFQVAPPAVALIYFSEDHSLPMSLHIEVDQRDKNFVEKMVVGAKGTEILFKNSDSVAHNIYANDPKSQVNFDAGLVPPGRSSNLKMDWEEGQVVRIGCKIHPKMQAYIANISSSHYAIVAFKPSDRKAGFRIEKVPEGLSRIRVWFPKHESVEIDLKKGSSITVRVSKSGKKDGDLTLSRQ